MPGRKTGHLQGGKFTASHTSVTQAAAGPASAAAGLECVSKVSLGFIKATPTGTPSIKFLDEGTCLLAMVRGGRSVQEIRVYTNDPEAVKEAMRQALR